MLALMVQWLLAKKCNHIYFYQSHHKEFYERKKSQSWPSYHIPKSVELLGHQVCFMTQWICQGWVVAE